MSPAARPPARPRSGSLRSPPRDQHPVSRRFSIRARIPIVMSRLGHFSPPGHRDDRRTWGVVSGGYGGWMVSRSDVEAARGRIGSRELRTPVLRTGGLWLKLEQLQHTGSFKARGAFNRVLAAAEAAGLPEAGVIAASGGNAGLAFAYAARELGAPAEVYVPEIAPAVKVARLRALGASVRQAGREYAGAYDAATKRAADSGALFCPPYDQPEVCAGQGTLALELEEQTGGVDTVLGSVGGGGLMAGIAAALG